MLEYYIWRIESYMKFLPIDSTIFIVLVWFVFVQFVRVSYQKIKPYNVNRCPWCGEIVTRTVPIVSSYRILLFKSNKCKKCKHLFRSDTKIITWAILLAAFVTLITLLSNNQPLWLAVSLFLVIITPEYLLGHLYATPVRKDFFANTHDSSDRKSYEVNLCFKTKTQKPQESKIYPICFVDEQGLPQSKIVCVSLQNIKNKCEKCFNCKITFLLNVEKEPENINELKNFRLYNNNQIV